MSKTVRIYDFDTKKTNVIPAAELAPGMLEANVAGVGRVWIKAAEVKGKIKHPPIEPAVRDMISRRIQEPLAEVFFQTLEEWEVGFRADVNPEREIAIWCRIAERFTGFSKSEGLNLEQMQECFNVMLHASNDSPEHIQEVVQLNALTREQAQRAIEAFTRGKD